MCVSVGHIARDIAMSGILLCFAGSKHLCPLGRVWLPPAAMVEEDGVNAAEEEVGNADRCSGLLIFGNWHSSCYIETKAPSEVRLVLGQANARRFCKLHLQLMDKDRQPGEKLHDGIAADEILTCALCGISYRLSGPSSGEVCVALSHQKLDICSGL